MCSIYNWLFLPSPNLFSGNDPFVATSSDSNTYAQYSWALQIPLSHQGNALSAEGTAPIVPSEDCCEPD